MKILFAIKTLKNAGGAERVMVEIANGLSMRGHNIVLISYDANNVKSFYPLGKAVLWHRLDLGGTDHPAILLETMARMRALRCKIVTLKPDIAVGFMTSMYIPLGFALVGSGIPVIASEHTVRARYFARPLERFLLSLMPLLVRAITVVSEDVKNDHPFFLRQRMIVIPNPVRLEVSSPADVLGDRKPRKTLLSVGRLTESKDYVTLIRAFSQIAHGVMDWDLRIIGDGNLRNALQNMICSLGLSERIFLQPATNNISAEYAAAQLFVLPSRFESLGLVVLEALAHGLPVVGFSDCQGINRLVQPGFNGALAAGEDRSKSLADVLMPLMTNAENRQLLVPPTFELPTVFSPEQVCDLWERTISNLSTNRHNPVRGAKN